MKRSLRIRNNRNTRTSQFKDSKNKNNQVDDQQYFTDSETTTPVSIKGKRKIKTCLTNKPIRLYNWNQPIRHIENYPLTVKQHKNDSK